MKELKEIIHDTIKPGVVASNLYCTFQKNGIETVNDLLTVFNGMDDKAVVEHVKINFVKVKDKTASNILEVVRAVRAAVGKNEENDISKFINTLCENAVNALNNVLVYLDSTNNEIQLSDIGVFAHDLNAASCTIQALLAVNEALIKMD